MRSGLAAVRQTKLLLSWRICSERRAGNLIVLHVLCLYRISFNANLLCIETVRGTFAFVSSLSAFESKNCIGRERYIVLIDIFGMYFDIVVRIQSLSSSASNA